MYHIKSRNKSLSDLDVVWNAIETHSVHRANNCPCGIDHGSKLWGFVTLHTKLIVDVDDFNEVEREALVNPHKGRFESGEQVRDSEGLAISPAWNHYHQGVTDPGLTVADWDDSTGIYELKGDGSVEVLYSPRNLIVDDVDTEVLDVLQVTDADARDRQTLIGRDLTGDVDLAKAPWMQGKKYLRRKGNVRRDNPAALFNRRDKRRGERLAG